MFAVFLKGFTERFAALFQLILISLSQLVFDIFARTSHYLIFIELPLYQALVEVPHSPRTPFVGNWKLY